MSLIHFVVIQIQKIFKTCSNCALTKPSDVRVNKLKLTASALTTKNTEGVSVNFVKINNRKKKETKHNNCVKNSFS